tara:strand:+ start:2750 stop:4711 length:1962 start_codon:yes stop_codon:yes gene_type:complete
MKTKNNFKKVFSFGLLIMALFSIVNLVSFERQSSFLCGQFTNPIFSNQSENIKLNYSDIYIFPEIENILCLNKVIASDLNGENLNITIGTNPKVVNYFTFGLFSFLLLFSNMLKKKEVIAYSFLSTFFLFFNFSYSLNIFTFCIITLFVFTMYFKKFDKSLNLIDLPNKLNKPFFSKILILFFTGFIFFTQFSTHNYETLSWDINSFLVTSTDIGNNLLPYEKHYENKPPLLFLFYYFVGKIAGGNLLFVKIINDIILILCAVNLYILLQQKKRNILISFIGTSLFAAFMSKNWFHPGYSEIYSLFFISISLILLNNKKSKVKIILSGIFFAVTTLVNIGTVIFVIPLFAKLYGLSKQVRDPLIFIASFSLIHFTVLLLYFSKGLVENYFVSMLTIPRNYPRAAENINNEFWIAFKDFSEYSFLLALALVVLISNLIITLLSEKVTLTNIFNSIEFFLVVISISFYYLAGMGYQHHLIFAIFFICYSFGVVRNNGIVISTLIICIFSLVNVLTINFNTSYENIRAGDELLDDYPLYNIANNYLSNVSSEDTILSLDNYLLLYYLHKENLSYISHPALYKSEFVLKPLSDINLVNINEIDYSISINPDYIICSNLVSECKNISGYKKVDIDKVNTSYLHYYYGTEKNIIILQKN